MRPATPALALALAAWCTAGGIAVAAPAPVTIAVDQGRPVTLPTYRGPAGLVVPAGACGAMIGGRLWVLPCTDPRVEAYLRGASRATARATRRTRCAEGLGVLAAAVGGAALTQCLHRRRHLSGMGA